MKDWRSHPPEVTAARAAQWIAAAHPIARRALFTTYAHLLEDHDPDFDRAAFAERVRREIARLHARAAHLLPRPPPS